jgi:hypothetical protein
LVVPGWVEGEGAQEFAGVFGEDADVEFGGEEQDALNRPRSGDWSEATGEWLRASTEVDPPSWASERRRWSRKRASTIRGCR